MTHSMTQIPSAVMNFIDSNAYLLLGNLVFMWKSTDQEGTVDEFLHTEHICVKETGH